MNNYSISTFSKKPFDETVKAVKAALTEEGFGVLTEIDVKEKMKEKIGKEMTPYIILGACHPFSAFEAIQVEEEIGLFLPCNVIIYVDEDRAVRVSAVRPTVAMSMIRNEKLGGIAMHIEKSLERIIKKI